MGRICLCGPKVLNLATITALHLNCLRNECFSQKISSPSNYVLFTHRNTSWDWGSKNKPVDSPISDLEVILFKLIIPPNIREMFNEHLYVSDTVLSQPSTVFMGCGVRFENFILHVTGSPWKILSR